MKGFKCVLKEGVIYTSNRQGFETKYKYENGEFYYYNPYYGGDGWVIQPTLTKILDDEYLEEAK